MATIRWYLVNGVDANGWQALSTTAQTAADTAAGWVVGTGLTNNAELAANTERASTTFTGTTVPDGTLDTSLKDAFRSPLLAGGGSFASANWTLQFTVVSPTQGGAADGQIVFRLIKANADGSSATEITSAQQSASVVTNVGSTDLGTAANVGTLTFNPGAITLTAGQYLFVQIAWKRTGAGGMTTTNIRFRTGSSTTVGTTILSSDFTPATQTITGTTIAVGSSVNVPTIINTKVVTLNALIQSTSLCGEVLLLESTNSGTNTAGVYQVGRSDSQTISGHSGTLSAVSFRVRAIGTPTDALYLEIRESSRDGTLLATSAQVSGAMVSFGGVTGTDRWVKFPLLSSVTLSAGTTYWIEFYTTRVSTDASNYYAVYRTGGDLYSGGEAKDSAGDPVTGWDFDFRLYIAAAPSVAYVVSGQTIYSTGTSHTVAVSAPSQSITGAFIGGGAAAGFVRLGSSKAGSPNALTFTTPSFNVPSGTTLIVGVIGEYTGTSSVLTNNHGDTVVIGSGQDPNGLNQVRAFWIVNPTPDAAYTLTATRAGNFYPSLCWAWYSGGHAAPFVMDTDGQNGVLVAPLVPTEDGCLLIAGSVHGAAGTTTTLLTEIQDQAVVGGTSFGTSLAEEIQTTATSRNPVITTVDVVVGVVFKPATGGGGGATLFAPTVAGAGVAQAVSGATIRAAFTEPFTGSGALSADWTSTALSATATVVRDSGEATASAVDAAQITSAYVSSVVFPADQYAQAKITAVPGGESGHYCELFVRASGSDTTFDGYLGGTNGNRIFLAKLIHNRAWTPLVDFPVHPGGIAVGDVLRLEAEGTTLRLKQNGTTIASATDSTLTSGAPGIGFLETSSILARSDDFEAGALAPRLFPPTVSVVAPPGDGPIRVQHVHNMELGGGDFSVTSGILDATPTSGHLLWAVLLIVTNGADRVITPPSGWTVLLEYVQPAEGYNLGIYWKIAGGSEPTSYTWTWDEGSYVQWIYLAEWSDVDAVTPIDVSAAGWTEYGLTAGPVAVPAITTLTDGAVDLVILNQQVNGPGYSLSGYTTELDDQPFGIFSRAISPAGSTGVRSVSVPSVHYTQAYSFALRPAAGAGGGGDQAVSGATIRGRIQVPQRLEPFTYSNGNLTAVAANWAYLGHVNASRQALAILSNQVRHTGASVSIAYDTGHTYSPDQYAQIVYRAASATTGYIGVAVRCDTADPNGVTSNLHQSCYWAECAPGWRSFGKVVTGGTFTEFTQDTVSLADGDVITLEARGSVIRVLINGVELWSQTDTAIASGAPGIFGEGNDVAALGDNWEGGDIAPTALFAPTVALAVVGDQAVTGTTLASGATLTPPTVALAGAQTVTGATITSGVGGAVPTVRAVALDQWFSPTSNPTATEPAGAVAGDVLITILTAWNFSSTPLTSAVPTGWMSLYDGTYNTGQGLGWRVGWTLRGSSAPSLVWSTDAAGGELITICVQDSAGTLHAQSAAGASGNDPNQFPDPPAVVTTLANCLAVVGGSTWEGSLSSGWVAPSGYTVRSAATALATAAATKLLSSPGSEDPGAFTNGANSGSGMHWLGFAVAVAPVVSAGIFAPTVALAAAGDQAVTGTTRASAATLFPPTVAAGAVTILGATITTGATVTAPTVAAGAITVIGTTITSGAALTAPTVTAGAVTVIGATITSGATLTAPTVAAGAVTIVGATRASSATLTVPTVTVGAVTVIGATLASTATLTPPTVEESGVITISAVTISSTAVVTAPTVAAGAVTIFGATLGGEEVWTLLLEDGTGLVRLEDGTGHLLLDAAPGLAQVFPPTVAAPTQAVTTAFLASAATVTAPTVAYGVLAATLASTATLTAPTVTTGAVTLVGVTIASTATLTAPTVAYAVTGATIGSTVTLTPPTVAAGAVTVAGATITSGAALLPPLVERDGETNVAGATIPSGTLVMPPRVALETVIEPPGVGPGPGPWPPRPQPPVVQRVRGAHLVNRARLRAPTVALASPTQTLQSASIPATSQLAAPALVPVSAVLVATVTSTAWLTGPRVTVVPPPLPPVSFTEPEPRPDTRAIRRAAYALAVAQASAVPPAPVVVTRRRRSTPPSAEAAPSATELAALDDWIVFNA